MQTLRIDNLRVFPRNLVPSSLENKDEVHWFEGFAEEGTPQEEVIKILNRYRVLFIRNCGNTVFIVASHLHDCNLYDYITLLVFTDLPVNRMWQTGEQVPDIPFGHERDDILLFLYDLTRGETVRAYIGSFLGRPVYSDIIYNPRSDKDVAGLSPQDRWGIVVATVYTR